MKKVLTSIIGVMSVVAVANAEPYVGINLIYDNIQLDKNFGHSINDITTPQRLGSYETQDVFGKNSFGASVNVGYQFNDYIGAEAYFQYNLQNSVNVSVNIPRFGHEKIWESKINFMSGGLDIMGYLPLNSSHSFSLIGTIGGGYYRFETQTNISPRFRVDTNSFDQHEDHLALRMGLGVQYNFNESMSVRALGRYVAWKQDTEYASDYIYNNMMPLVNHDIDLTPVNGMWEGSIGVQYKF